MIQINIKITLFNFADKDNNDSLMQYLCDMPNVASFSFILLQKQSFLSYSYSSFSTSIFQLMISYNTAYKFK